MKKALPVIFFLLTALFWGGSFVAIKFSIAEITPLIGTTLRVLIATLFLRLIYLPLRKKTKVPRDIQIEIWLIGIIAIAIPFSLLFWGETLISAGLAGIINGTVPIWTFLLGAVFFRSIEDFSKRKFIGIVLGLAGMICIFFPFLAFDGKRDELVGVFAVFGMSIAYSIAAVFNRRLFASRNDFDLLASVYQQHIAAAAYLVIMVCIFKWNSVPAIFSMGLKGWLAVLYLGIFSTGLAYLMYYTVIKMWGAVRGTAITYVVPIISLILQFFVQGVAPGSWELAGITFILAGVLFMRDKKKPPIMAIKA